MGQQQLLLLVLGIVLVGLAVVVGISAFNETNRKSRIDLATSVGVRIASESIAWKARPASLGGGEGTDRLTQVDFVKLGLQRGVGVGVPGGRHRPPGPL